MSDIQVLAEALIFLDGQGEATQVDPQARAAVLVAQLAERGYVVRPPAGSPLDDRSPANLVAVRRRLGLRVEDVAREAGVSVNTIRKVENAARRPHTSSVEAVAAALARLSGGST